MFTLSGIIFTQMCFQRANPTAKETKSTKNGKTAEVGQHSFTCSNNLYTQQLGKYQYQVTVLAKIQEIAITLSFIFSFPCAFSSQTLFAFQEAFLLC